MCLTGLKTSNRFDGVLRSTSVRNVLLVPNFKEGVACKRQTEMLTAFCTCRPATPQWGTADAEVKILSVEIQVLTFKGSL